MKYKVGYIVFVFLLTVATVAQAQVQFNFNGLGRAIVTSNKMGGETLRNDTISPSKGVSGYTLFDLQPNLVINNNIRANAILRLRNPFGSFYGANTAFSFRQFQIMGKIGKSIDYEIGDIYLGGMTKYTMFNPTETYHEFESEIHAMRREIVHYENFVNGNMWRMQGVQGRSLFGFNKGIKTLGVNLFATRTNATNEQNIPDRILAGGRVAIAQSEYLSIGLNYVGMLDVPVQASEVNYTNNVYTADAKLTLDREKFLIQLKGEFGASDFKNTQVLADSTVSYSDYVYEAGLKGVYKPVKLKLFGTYRYVGPQFSSPSAQTSRLNVARSVSMFDKICNGDCARYQTLYDRLTDEQIYNRAVSAVLYNFLPQYGNLSPYGEATPNRTGITFGIGTDTSAKILRAEARADLYNEVIGEGVSDKRQFTAVRGGLLFNFGDLLKIGRKMSINAGARQEITKRSGLAPIDFKSLMIDAGGSFEVVKKFDLLLGIKWLTASGNEYLGMRDHFNLLNNFTPYQVDLTETIYSFGARLRFSERSYFTVNYNTTGYKELQTYNYNYGINQLFFNYTLIF
jgi:hypothetical protein